MSFTLEEYLVKKKTINISEEKISIIPILYYTTKLCAEKKDYIFKKKTMCSRYTW